VSNSLSFRRKKNLFDFLSVGYLEPSVSVTKECAVWIDETISVGPRPLSMSTYQQEDPLQISVEGNE
jgi:hypothetical protein